MKFESVQRFLRAWPWIDGEPNQYDLCGCLHLLSDISSNISKNAHDDELLEFLSENPDFFSHDQLDMFRKILKHQTRTNQTADNAE